MPSSQIGLHDSYLIKIISKNPGIHYSGIRKIVNLSNGSLERNLKRLEESNSVKVYREIQKTRYFDKSFSEKYFKDLSILRRPTLKNIVEMLLDHNNLFFKEIVKKTKLSPATISYSLDKLCLYGFVERNPGPKKSISLNLKNKQRVVELLNVLKI